MEQLTFTKKLQHDISKVFAAFALYVEMANHESTDKEKKYCYIVTHSYMYKKVVIDI